MNLVFIYGPPGVGKLTVARELAALTGYKLFHNHVTIDWAKTLFDFGTEPFWKLVVRLRQTIFEEAAAEGVSIVGTFVYAYPSDEPLRLATEAIWQDIASRGANLHFVQLTCEAPELLRRIEAPHRIEMQKLASAETLSEQMERWDYFRCYQAAKACASTTPTSHPPKRHAASPPTTDSPCCRSRGIHP
jgi:hypothetical protein